MKEVGVGILVYGRSMRSSLFGLLELFNLASDLGTGLADPVRFSCKCFAGDSSPLPEGVNEGALESCSARLDCIIVPPQTKEPNVKVCTAEGGRWLKRQHDSGAIVASACVGAFVLAECGLLNGRKATTHWMLADQFRDRFPEVDLVDDNMIVDEGDIVTAGGVTAWVDLALRLVARFGSPELAMKLGKFYLVDTGLREQRFYRIFQPRFNHGDEEVLLVQRWIAVHFEEPLADVDLAKKAGLSVRSLQRRFQVATGESPAKYLRKFRLGKACELLETTRKTVDEIVWKVGYEDQSAFRKLFKDQMGLTPSEYRKRFAS